MRQGGGPVKMKMLLGVIEAQHAGYRVIISRAPGPGSPRCGRSMVCGKGTGVRMLGET